MKGFNWAGTLPGHKNPIVRKIIIPTATAIEKGEPIDFTQGTGAIVLAGPTDFDDPIYGVSNQEHAANSGTELEIIEPDGQLFKYKAAKTYTMTGGSTTTAVDSSIVPQTDNFWKGGMIKIISCAADSSLNGRLIPITASTGSTGTFTFAAQTAALASGDTYQICPGPYADGYLGYDLDSDAMNPDYDANGGNVLKIRYSNPATMETFFTFERYAIVT